MYTELDISKPPVFDFDKAIAVTEATANRIFSRTPNVLVMANIWLYNNPESSWPSIIQRVDQLDRLETNAASTFCPLPTIGLEVESPRNPYNRTWAPRFAIFFDLLGLPRNRINKNVKVGDLYTYSGMWEFSTQPAYSAAVANRTLAELIKGNFIPHLQPNGDKNPTAEDRRELLDSKLVSLHVNLGVPSQLTQYWLTPCNGHTSLGNPDITTLGSAFSLAFTSPERLASRTGTNFIDVKLAEPKPKSGMHRFEVKALEVSGVETYRLIEEIQSLAAAAFSSMQGDNSSLTEIWKDTSDRISCIYKLYGVTPEMLKNKPVIAAKIRVPGLQDNLRSILTTGALQVRHLLYSNN